MWVLRPQQKNLPSSHPVKPNAFYLFMKLLILPLYLSPLRDFQRPIHLLLHVLRYDLTLPSGGCRVRLSWNPNPCVMMGPSRSLSRLCFTHLWNKHRIVPIGCCETCGKLLKWLRIGPTLNSSKHLKSCPLKKVRWNATLNSTVIDSNSSLASPTGIIIERFLLYSWGHLYCDSDQGQNNSRWMGRKLLSDRSIFWT